MKLILIFIALATLNSFNDILLKYNYVGEWDFDVAIYGAIHFLTFAGAYYLILKNLIK